ncbi:MAG: TIGR03936 family radical SAM-associated protein [Chthonomonadales bacterium]
MKYLITFEKGDSARWLGHLDILRTFERAIRRSELPIAFTSGFNPRERISFASALPVGVTGSFEPATIELTSPIPPAQVITQLNEKLPPGIQLRTAEVIPDENSRDVMNLLNRAEMDVICTFPDGVEIQELEAAVAELMAQPELMVHREREKKTRDVDIRPYLHEILVRSIENGRLNLTITFAFGSEGSARPSEVISFLATQFPGIAVRRVHRSRLLNSDA